MVKYLENAEDFKAATAGLVLIDFTATWCPPCKMIGPIFEKLAEANADSELSFRKVDVDKNAAASTAAGIEAMPTFQVWKEGKKIEEFRGASEQKLNALVKKYTTV